MGRQGSSSGSRSQTAFRLAYRPSEEEPVRRRVYWSKKSLIRKLAELTNDQVVAIDEASIRWVRRV